MQKNTVTSFDRPAQPLVKPDPQLEKLDKNNRRSKWSIILFAFGTLLMVVTLILFFWFKRPLTILLPDLFIMLSSGGSILFLRFLTKNISKYWKQLEQHRQAAARGDQRLLADEQPVADGHVYTLPFTIRQSPRKASFMLMSGTTFLSSIIGISLAILFLTHIVPLPHHTDWPPTLVFSVIGVLSLFGLVATIAFAILMYTRVRQQITLTENGLMQVGLSRKVRSIPWSEARLFAILGIYGAKKYPSPALFELSSGNEIIRWNWIRRNSMRVLYFANSRVDTAEYERQMNGALSIIAAKTGLPLYDLRKEMPG
jgi:protein-S-isoprenylcysteine O-methyltransferase Ste14